MGDSLDLSINRHHNRSLSECVRAEVDVAEQSRPCRVLPGLAPQVCCAWAHVPSAVRPDASRKGRMPDILARSAPDRT